MNRADYYRLRSVARCAILARDMLGCDPHATWQDRQRAQQWVQTCVGRLPGYAYARPLTFVDRQSRFCMYAQFPQWTARRLHLRQRRQQEAVRRLIGDTLAPLGPSILEQNIAAQAERLARTISPLTTATGIPPVLSPERAVVSTSLDSAA